MASNTEEHNGGGALPEIELIIKASTIDGRRKGACLFCHEYFMDLYLLAELKTISLKITTVDMLKPPPDFRYYIYSNIWVTFLNPTSTLNIFLGQILKPLLHLS